MLQKFFNWHEEHRQTIELILAVAAIVELFVIASAFMALGSTIDLIHDIEVQLAAHGVEWALYTPIP